MPSTRAVFSSPAGSRLERAAAYSFLALVATMPWSIAPMSIAVALCTALTLLTCRSTGFLERLRSPLTIPALGWLAALVVAALVGGGGDWRPVVKGLLLVLVPVAAAHATEERAGRRALAVLFVSCAVATVFALAEFWARGGAFPARVRGAAGHPLTYGGQALLLSSLALALAVRAPERRWRLAGAGLLVLLVPALLGSYTRSAWLGFFAAAATIIAFTRARWLPLLAGAVVLTFLLLPPGYRERALSSFSLASPWNAGRLAFWRIGFRMFADHPIAGVGFQDFGAIYDRYRDPGAPPHVGHLHSVWMHVAVTMGVVGLAALGGLILGLFRTAGSGLLLRARPNAGARPARVRSLGAAVQLGVSAGLVGFLVAAFFEWNLGDEELLDLLYPLVGIAFAASGWAASPGPGGSGQVLPVQGTNGTDSGAEGGT